jgi:hypothetical protein
MSDDVACAECRTLGHAPGELDSEGRCAACQPAERRVVRAGSRTIYVLELPEAAVTYESNAHDSSHASMDFHSREPHHAAVAPSGRPCEFLTGSPDCYFDGSSLNPAQPNEDAIWSALETMARGHGWLS